jgi:hypothetical protein
MGGGGGEEKRGRESRAVESRACFVLFFLFSRDSYGLFAVLINDGFDKCSCAWRR